MEFSEASYDKIAKLIEDEVGEIFYSDLTEEKFFELIALIIKIAYAVGTDEATKEI